MIFLPIAGRREGEGGETKRGKTKKEQYTHRANSNLPGESIARESQTIISPLAKRQRAFLLGFFKKEGFLKDLS